MHAMQQIAESGSTPMKAKPLPTMTQDDRIKGMTLANEAIALAKGNSNKWRALAITIIGLTVEARGVFLSTIKAERTALTKQQTEAGFTAKGYAKGVTASFSVELSKLATIASAFNGGASVSGWREYINKMQEDKTKHATDDAEVLEHAGYETLVSYARTFSQSSAGRKADDWVTKFGKFLERNKPDADDDKMQQHYEAAVKLYNSMVK